MWATLLVGALSLSRPRLRAGQRRAPPQAPIGPDSTPRAVAHHVLLRCSRNGAFAERALAGTLGKAALGGADAALATALVYGVLRDQRLLDFQLEQLTRLNRTDDASLTALRIGAYELTQLRTPDHAAVGEAVALAAESRRRGFLNGVLRNLARRRNPDGLLHLPLEEPEDVLSEREVRERERESPTERESHRERVSHTESLSHRGPLTQRASHTESLSHMSPF